MGRHRLGAHGETFHEPTRGQHKQLARAKRKRGRPRMGAGVRVISVSIEKGLRRKIDSLAKRKKAKGAELISQGLRRHPGGPRSCGLVSSLLPTSCPVSAPAPFSSAGSLRVVYVPTLSAAC
jgi:hypothetical protein